MLIEKPKTIIITVRDRIENNSKSMTVYETDIDEVFNKIKACLHSTLSCP